MIKFVFYQTIYVICSVIKKTMQQDNLLEIVHEGLNEYELSQIADSQGLFILQPLPYEQESQWARVYSLGYTSEFSQQYSKIVAVPKYLKASILEALHFFDSELQYQRLIQTATEKTDITRNGQVIGYIDFTYDQNRRKWHQIWIDTKILNIKIGDIATTASGKLFGEKAGHAKPIDYDATIPVFAEYTDIFMVNGKEKVTDILRKPTISYIKNGFAVQGYEETNVSDSTVHLGASAKHNGMNVIAKFSIVGAMNGRFMANRNWVEVEKQEVSLVFNGKKVQHGVYVLKNPIQSLMLNTGTPVFTANGHRVISYHGNERLLVNIHDIYGYYENEQVCTFYEYQLLEPIEGSICKLGDKQVIYAPDLYNSGITKRIVKVFDKEYILALPHQIVATNDN